MYLRPKGYSVVTDGWGVQHKQDTTKCWHCQTILFFGAGERPEHKCYRCNQPICQHCVGKPCLHWEQKLDQDEQTDRWLQDRFAEKLSRAVNTDDAYQIRCAMERERFRRELGVI